MDVGGLAIILVVDERFRLLGILTDGDIRRLVIKGQDLNIPICKVMNSDPIVALETLKPSQIDLLFKEHKIAHIPLVDEQNILKDLKLKDKATKAYLPNPVLLMAGGLGKRMRPLTDNCPKPMLKLGSKPILEYIINDLVETGFCNFYISTYYLSHVIKDYFRDGSNWGISITYIDEDKPLGTGGAINLLPAEEIKEPVLLMNGDVLTDLDFRKLLNNHISEKSLISVGVREETYTIPFGVVETNEKRVTGIIEKPHTNII